MVPGENIDLQHTRLGTLALRRFDSIFASDATDLTLCLCVHIFVLTRVAGHCGLRGPGGRHSHSADLRRGALAGRAPDGHLRPGAGTQGSPEIVSPPTLLLSHPFAPAPNTRWVM